MRYRDCLEEWETGVPSAREGLLLAYLYAQFEVMCRASAQNSRETYISITFPLNGILTFPFISPPFLILNLAKGSLVTSLLTHRTFNLLQ